MASYLTPEQVDDFVETTINRFFRHEWTDISLEHQEYVFSTIFNDKKIIEKGGPQIEFKVQHKNTGNARNTGLYDEDQTKVDDVMINGKVPWTAQTTNWSYDIYEDVFQSDRETIIREMVVREHDAMNALAELQEENLWSAPTGTSDNRPMGVPFWMQKDAATTPGGGFNGGNPSGFTSGAAGIDSTEYDQWRNWTFGYDAVQTNDLVTKLKKAMAFTTFVPPHKFAELGWGGVDYAMYTTFRVTEPLERLAETRNDNLGADVARYVNAVVVGGVPTKWVPYLEANDTDDPIYGINWQVFRPYTKKGADMRRHPPKIAPKQHTVREVHIDCWMNFACINRRRLFVGSKSS